MQTGLITGKAQYSHKLFRVCGLKIHRFPRQIRLSSPEQHEIPTGDDTTIASQFRACAAAVVAAVAAATEAAAAEAALVSNSWARPCEDEHVL